MSQALLVPIHLDAFHVQQPTTVIEPTVDFSRLPYNDDAQPEAPFLSELVRAQPFENQQFGLEIGVHLHWALPDALTRAIDGVFPPVPNRWIVTRRSNAGEVREWLVESDYVHPIDEVRARGSVAFPFPARAGTPPFRFVGRSFPLAERHTAAPPREFMPQPLTAVGFGDPAFAALYANCRGVFGFYDDYAGDVIGLEYEVIGWWAESANDVVQRLRAHMTKEGDAHTQSELLRALRQEHRWLVDVTTANPEYAICYARLRLGDMVELRADDITIAAGNTGVEALAAHVGHEVAPAHQQLVERMLEVAQLGARLDDKAADADAKFHEAWHEKGFRAVGAGALWTVVAQSASGTVADADDARARAGIELPATFAAALSLVNATQQAYERAHDELRELKRQLFADWYRYQLAMYPPIETEDPYPDPDEIRDFIEQRVLSRIDSLSATTGHLKIDGEANAGRIASVSATPAGSVADRLATALRELLRLTDELNARDDVRKANLTFRVARRDSPRYWLPTEPVLALAGRDARATRRHGFDGRLRADELLLCDVLDNYTGAPVDAAQLGAIRARLDDLSKQPNRLGFQSGSGKPWNPLLLEWMVEFFPGRAAAAPDVYGAHYSPTYITDSWQLDADAVELRPAGIDFDRGANVYVGASILTPHAGIKLEESLAAEVARIVKPLLLDAFGEARRIAAAQRNESVVLERRAEFDEWAVAQQPILPRLAAADDRSAADQFDGWLRANAIAAAAWGQARNGAVARYCEMNAIPPAARTAEQLDARVDDFLNWYAAELGESKGLPRTAVLELKTASQLIVLHASLKWLLESPCLAQSLSGFNESLLMQHQSLQLPVDDPFAFDFDRAFVQRVRAHVGRQNRSAPQALDDFNPIRAGALDLIRLRLVDTFGQVRELSWHDVTAADTLRSTDARFPIVLPPRVMQPLRLNFRWIAASSRTIETNAHPETSPICGWLVPNSFDTTLMAYDANGRALGALTLDPDMPWRAAPGSDQHIEIAAIDDDVLRRVLGALEAQQRASNARREETTFLERYLAMIDNALLHIEPERTPQHQGVVVLMGQPLALVRATVDLELQGPPAPHQGWSSFRKDMRTGERDTRGFQDVQFPIRIGEHGQLNDGLVGYWLDSAIGTAGERFYAPQSDLPSDDYISTRDADAVHLSQTIAAPAQMLTMLVDPRAVVHATCGIAPTKAIDIPTEHYASALSAIEATFLSAPLLTDRGAIRITLPDEPGNAWSWIDRESGGWRERGSAGEIEAVAFDALFGQAGRDIWNHLIERGWLQRISAEKASVVATDARRERDLAPPFTEAVARVEALLATTHLTPFQPLAAFHGRQELREGWLKLRNDPVNIT